MILILTGPIHSGKTSLLKKVAGRLKDLNVPIEGFLSESINKEGDTFGYDLYDLRNGQTIPFIRKQGQKEWEKIGAYSFIPAGLERAKKIIMNHDSSYWLFIDEIGPLELEGKGLWPVLRHSLRVPQQKIICVVREQILESFLQRIEIPDNFVYDIRDGETSVRLIKKNTSPNKGKQD